MRPPPPYVLTAGALDQRLEEDAYVVLPNPPCRGRYVIAEWLVRLQGRRRVTVEPVALADGSDGLLVLLEGVWSLGGAA